MSGYTKIASFGIRQRQLGTDQEILSAFPLVFSRSTHYNELKMTIMGKGD